MLLPSCSLWLIYASFTFFITFASLSNFCSYQPPPSYYLCKSKTFLTPMLILVVPYPSCYLDPPMHDSWPLINVLICLSDNLPFFSSSVLLHSPIFAKYDYVVFYQSFFFSIINRVHQTVSCKTSITLEWKLNRSWHKTLLLWSQIGVLWRRWTVSDIAPF